MRRFFANAKLPTRSFSTYGPLGFPKEVLPFNPIKHEKPAEPNDLKKGETKAVKKSEPKQDPEIEAEIEAENRSFTFWLKPTSFYLMLILKSYYSQDTRLKLILLKILLELN